MKITDFSFTFAGYGHYNVSYTSPKTGKKWSKIINHMPLIDATKNADNPTQTAMKELKQRVKA